jgi:TusA-related sulfurtransferase
MEDKTIEEMVYDIRGQVCPSSLLTTLRQVNIYRQKLKLGLLRLLVITDARDATVTIPKMVANMGYQASVSKQDGNYFILIGKVG